MIVLSDDDDDDGGGASPASATSSTSSVASHQRRPTTSTAHGTTLARSTPPSSSSKSSIGVRRPARVNPTTLPPSGQRKQVQRLNIEQQPRAEEERKEANDERQRPSPRDRAARTSAARSILSDAVSGSGSPRIGASGGAEQKKMEFVPRPEAVTHAVEYKSAESEGHPAQAWALCEFIDNALSALRKSLETDSSLQSEIKILFVEPTAEYAQTKKMYILIRYAHFTLI